MQEKEYYLKIDNLYNRALLLVSDLFQDKKDKAGFPYINHLIRVSVKLDTEELRIAGLLHDVLEDTSITKDDLRELGFSNRVISIIEGVTNKVGENYNDKIKRIIDNGDIDVIKLKYSDMSDNADKKRLVKLSIITRNRLINKYKDNLELLKKALEGKNENSKKRTIL